MNFNINVINDICKYSGCFKIASFYLLFCVFHFQLNEWININFVHE